MGASLQETMRAGVGPLVKPLGFWSQTPNLNSGSAAYQLCNPGQVTKPLCGSISPMETVTVCLSRPSCKDYSIWIMLKVNVFHHQMKRVGPVLG